MEMKDWISTARTTGKLTQTQLGESLGVTKGNVSAWENGRHEPSWSQILRISEVTGAALPLPEHLRQANPAWPFTVDYALFTAMPEEQRSRLNDYVSKAVHSWHNKIS